MATAWNMIERVRETHRGVAPNLTTLGFFDDSIQLIGLPAVTKADLDATKGEYHPEAHSKVYPLLCHELRHWFDFVGTLWGQKHFICLFNALNSRLNNDPSLFAPIMTYENAVRKMHLIDYYTTTNDSDDVASSQEKWKMQRTIGHRFSATGEMLEHRRILFVNFTTQDGRFVGRSPVSISSLLETGAMYSELYTHIGISCTVPEAERERYAENNAMPYFEKFEYEPTMRTYSVAAHLTANVLHIEDTFHACAVASALSNLALNLPEPYFALMRRSKAFEAFPEVDIDLRAERDIPYAFITLLDNLSDLNSTDIQSILANVPSLSGLPEGSELKSGILREMQTIRGGIINGPFRHYLDELLDYGRIIFEQRGPFGDGLREFDAAARRKYLPPIMLGDNKIWLPQAEDGSNIWEDLEGRWDLTAKALGQIEEFVDICGV